MSEDLIPEVRMAVDALEKRITITESEIDQMKESIRAKKSLVRSWRKGLAAISPRAIAKRKTTKQASSSPRKPEPSAASA